MQLVLIEIRINQIEIDGIINVVNSWGNQQLMYGQQGMLTPPRHLISPDLVNLLYECLRWLLVCYCHFSFTVIFHFWWTYFWIKIKRVISISVCNGTNNVSYEKAGINHKKGFIVPRAIECIHLGFYSSNV